MKEVDAFRVQRCAMLWFIKMNCLRFKVSRFPSSIPCALKYLSCHSGSYWFYIINFIFISRHRSLDLPFVDLWRNFPSPFSQASCSSQLVPIADDQWCQSIIFESVFDVNRTCAGSTRMESHSTSRSHQPPVKFLFGNAFFQSSFWFLLISLFTSNRRAWTSFNRCRSQPTKKQQQQKKL